MAWVAGLGLTACERPAEPPSPRVKQVFHLNPFEKDFGYLKPVDIEWAVDQVHRYTNNNNTKL